MQIFILAIPILLLIFLLLLIKKNNSDSDPVPAPTPTPTPTPPPPTPSPHPTPKHHKKRFTPIPTPSPNPDPNPSPSPNSNPPPTPNPDPTPFPNRKLGEDCVLLTDCVKGLACCFGKCSKYTKTSVLGPICPTKGRRGLEASCDKDSQCMSNNCAPVNPCLLGIVRHGDKACCKNIDHSENKNACSPTKCSVV